MIRSQTQERGFTIVEVVVALGILSLLMLATITALRTLATTRNSIDRQIARVDDIRAVSQFIRAGLEASTPDSLANAGLSLGGRSGVATSAWFRGDEQSLEWKAPVLFGEGFGGTHLLRIERRDESLFLRWQAVRETSEEIEWADAPSRLLVSGLEEFTLHYREDFVAPWEDEWSRQGAPELVQFTIKANGRYWPDLIARVQQIGRAHV